MMQAAMIIATEAAGLMVCAAAVCRLGKMQYGRHRTPWLAVYGLMAVGGLRALFEAHQADVSPALLLALAACALYLWLSRHTWRGNAPAYMERAAPPAPLPEPFNLAAGQTTDAAANVAQRYASPQARKGGGHVG